MTTARVPLIDETTGRFPDAYAPPSVAAAVTTVTEKASAAAVSAAEASEARDAAQSARTGAENAQSAAAASASAAAVSATKAAEARDAAEAARDQAETFSATTVTLQDAAVKSLIENESSQTRTELNSAMDAKNPYAQMSAAAKEMVLSRTHAATGNFPYEWIDPGVYYSSGQWLWDSAFGAVIAAGMGEGARAQNWLSNWISSQAGTSTTNPGMLPSTIAVNSRGWACSQPPILSWAVREVYAATGDSAWLATMYPMLRKFHVWWRSDRMDESVTGMPLFSWGRNSAIAESFPGQNAGKESGQDRHTLFYDAQYATVDDTYYRVQYACPDLCALMVKDAEMLAELAGEVGQTADVTTFTTHASSYRAAMEKYLWSEDQSIYLGTQMHTFAVSLGAISGALTVDSSEVVVATPLGTPLVAGDLLVFANGVTGEVGASDDFGAHGSDAWHWSTTIPLARSKYPVTSSGIGTNLSGTVPDGTTVKVYRRQWAKPLSFISHSLWAEVPTPARAERMVDEWITKRLDGTQQDTCTISFGSAFGANNRISKQQYVGWRGENPADSGFTATLDACTLSTAGSKYQIFAPGLANASKRAYGGRHRNDVMAGPQRPISVSVTYEQPASTTDNLPRVCISNYAQNRVLVDASDLNSGASSGVTGSVSAPTVASTERPFIIEVHQTGAAATGLKLRAVRITSFPSGPLFGGDYGLTCTLPQSDYFFTAPMSDNTSEYDYWLGDYWVNLEYMALMGMKAYGMGAAAQKIARTVVDRVLKSWTDTGEFWERYGARGQGKGTSGFVWTALVVNLIHEFDLQPPRQ